MRRKVRGTVSGIYMYSAHLESAEQRRHGSTALEAQQQNGFSRFCKWAQFVSIRVQSRLWHLCERPRLGSLIISRDNLTMNQWEHTQHSEPQGRGDARLTLS